MSYEREAFQALWPPNDGGTHWDGCWVVHKGCFALRQIQRAEAAEAQVLALRRATLPNHAGHWDATGGSGSGCPECQRIRTVLADTEAAAKAIEQRIEQRGYDRAKAEDRAIIAQGIALSKAQP